MICDCFGRLFTPEVQNKTTAITKTETFAQQTKTKEPVYAYNASFRFLFTPLMNQNMQGLNCLDHLLNFPGLF